MIWYKDDVSACECIRFDETRQNHKWDIVIHIYTSTLLCRWRAKKKNKTKKHSKIIWKEESSTRNNEQFYLFTLYLVSWWQTVICTTMRNKQACLCITL